MTSLRQQKKPGFRTDINGLRAWAVLAVMFYHFGIPGFSGGFVGVDIFFVISGFLMTGIIVGGLEQTGGRGRFSLIDFYLARARRIVPALVALCVVLLLFGWFVLPPADYRMLGKHVVSSIAFFSNITFWSEAGYFDAASHEKWLLHTWSLSVEWQFYLLLPLALVTVWKFWPGRRHVTIFVTAGFLLSLALSIVISPIKPDASYYLLPVRAWELLAGGMVYLVSGRIHLSEAYRRLVEWSGLLLIAFSAGTFHASRNWPGWQAMIPVAGAMLILVASRSDSIWIGSRAAQWLGACSYSLYLWHWPVVVALVYLDLLDNAGAVIAGLVLTLALGRLSYLLIENPTRRYLERVKWSTGVAGLAMATLVVATPAVAVVLQDGVRGRLPPQVAAIFDAADHHANPGPAECHIAGITKVTVCAYGGPKLGAIVLGDSHAASIVRSVEQALPDKSFHVLDWSVVGCPTLLGVHKDNSPLCGGFLKWALLRQADLPSNVPLIIMNRLTAYAFGNNEPDRKNEPFPSIYFDRRYSAPSPVFLEEFRTGIISTACEFAKTRPVYLVRPVPELKLNVPKTMGRALFWGWRREVSISLKEYQQRHAFVLAAQDAAHEKCGVHILDPLPFLCGNGRCNGAKEGLPLYFDDDHLNAHGDDVLVPMFAKVFARK